MIPALSTIYILDFLGSRGGYFQIVAPVFLNFPYLSDQDGLIEAVLALVTFVLH